MPAETPPKTTKSSGKSHPSPPRTVVQGRSLLLDIKLINLNTSPNQLVLNERWMAVVRVGGVTVPGKQCDDATKAVQSLLYTLSRTDDREASMGLLMEVQGIDMNNIDIDFGGDLFTLPAGD